MTDTGRYPNLYLVGAPKCGTTSLFDWFNAHDDVYCGYRKEPGTLAGTREAPLPAGMSYDDYLKMYADWTDQTYALDASTRYLASPVAAENIAGLAVNPKIMMVLRNPVDAIYSLYFYHFSDGKEHIATFEDALQSDDESPPERQVIRQRYRASFTYPPSVSRYFDTFGRDNVKCILFDDLRSDDTQVMQDVCQWLGIEYPDTRLRKSNPARAARFKSLNKLILSPPEPARRLAAMVFSKATRLKIRRVLHELNGRSRPNPPMNPDTRRTLEAQFAPQIDELSKLLGRDLSHWKGDHA